MDLAYLIIKIVDITYRIWILFSDHLIWYIYYLRFEKRFCSYVMWMIYMKIRSGKCSLARISVHFPFITNSRTVRKGFYCSQRSQTRATCCWPCCYKCHGNNPGCFISIFSSRLAWNSTINTFLHFFFLGTL